MSDKDNDFLKLLKEQDSAQSDDLDLQAHLQDVKPLTQDKVAQNTPLLDKRTADLRKEAAQKMPEKELDSASSAFVPMVEPNDVLEYRRPGVQPYILRKLRQGEYSEADFIDLHGKTIEKAYDMVMHFLTFAKQQEFRCILIIHGKGMRQKQKALMKSYVAHWLRQIPEVLAFHSAPEWKGGTGAVMVILKKGEKASAENREQYARR
ncbi:MAG: DNA endonuclease SmrA [Succinivibrio sp.]|nr:DNA endonuclease SmrA [Succinivibrio sp.]